MASLRARLADVLGRTAAPKDAFAEPDLTDVQRSALSALRTDGIAILPFEELFDQSLWQELDAEMQTFAREAAVHAERGDVAGKKDFLIRRYPRGKSKMPLEPAVLASDSPWLRFAAGDPLLGIVNSYRQANTKLVDFDLWYTIPTASSSERHASQQWHRDPEDQHVVKVFLYFVDVDEGTGPFEYVRQSPAGAKYGDLWPWGSGTRYPPTDELEHLVSPTDRILATGPAGTLVICDTSGFHRGGYAESKPRILCTQTYVNRKVTADKPERRKFQVDWRGNQLSEQARIALT